VPETPPRRDLPLPGAPPPPLVGGGSNENLITLVRERRTHALSRYTALFTRVARWYDLYRGVYSGRFQQFRNNIHIPFLFSVIQSDVARKVQTSFGAWPVVEFVGYGHSDSHVARKNSTLVSAQMKDCDSFVKAVDFFLSADMYGTGIARVGWKQERRLEQRRGVIMGPDGQSREQVIKGPVDRFDGPNWDVVDILDFWPQPGKRRIDEMDWVIHRYWMDLDEIEEMTELGVFDKSSIAQLKRGTAMPPQEGDQTRYSVYRSFSEYEARKQERFAKPVEIWEMWGRVPREYAPDGLVHRVVTLGNGAVVMKNRPNPFWHGEIPFKVYCPMPDPHYFHGPGKVEIGEKMQYTANRFANQKMDAMDIVVDPVWLFDRSRGIDTQNLYTRAGRTIGIDGPVDETVIRTLSPDLRGLQLAYTEIGQLWNWIQQGTGIVEDTISGMPSSSRQTKAEFVGRQENVLTRLMLEARLAEEAFIEPLANNFRDLNKQFLTVPHEVKILGNDAQINPITGFPMPQEPTQVNLEDINADYRARATGATQMLGRQMRQQNLMMLLQTMQVNPIALQMVNWNAFLRQTFEAFDMKNTDELFNTQPTQLGASAAEQKPPTPQEQENAAMAPEGGGGDMPPEAMQQMMAEMGLGG
jgi:hypothetical protein